MQTLNKIFDHDITQDYNYKLLIDRVRLTASTVYSLLLPTKKNSLLFLQFLVLDLGFGNGFCIRVGFGHVSDCANMFVSEPFFDIVCSNMFVSDCIAEKSCPNLVRSVICLVFARVIKKNK